MELLSEVIDSALITEAYNPLIKLEKRAVLKHSFEPVQWFSTLQK